MAQQTALSSTVDTPATASQPGACWRMLGASLGKDLPTTRPNFMGEISDENDGYRYLFEQSHNGRQAWV